MILFFLTPQKSIIATQVDHELSQNEVEELCWLYGGATLEEGSGLNVDGEDFLVETIVHALQHGVVFRLFALYGEVLLNTRNAVEIHILGNLYGIGAPRSNHFTARSYIPTLQLATFF